MRDDCGAVDEFVVLGVWFQEDLSRRAESGWFIDGMKPFVEVLFTAGDANFDLCAVIVSAFGVSG